jgi:hypothetical protein
MKLILVYLTIFNVLRVAAQDFVNLDFNSPDLSGSLVALEPGSARTPYLGSAYELLRGWTVYGDGVPLRNIAFQPGSGDLYNPVTLRFTRFPSPSPVNYNIYIESLPPRMIDLTFHQRGQIPLNASSLSFFANGLMEMRVNGELLHTIDTSVSVFPIVDISQFAGQVVDLDFHVLQFPGAGASFSFDVIGFSQVPEPSTWALCGVGAVFLAAASLRRYRN